MAVCCLSFKQHFEGFSVFVKSSLRKEDSIDEEKSKQPFSDPVAVTAPSYPTAIRTRNVEIPRKPGFPTGAAIKNMDKGR